MKWPIVRAGWPIGLDWHHRFVPTTLSGLVMVLKQMGWEPDTCVDVGVAWGTVELQRGFASSRQVLVEPNPIFAAYLADKARTAGWRFHQVAAGDTEGSLSFLVTESHQGARVVSDGGVVSGSGSLITVPATTLDSLDAAESFGERLLLKIDVEGYEGQVLKGAANVLARAEVVVVETSPTGGVTSSEIVGMLLEHDLLLLGFLTPWVVSRRWRRLQMVDLVFIRRTSSLLLRPSA